MPYLLLFFFLCSSALWAQLTSPYPADALSINLQKYWQYRQRFLGDGSATGFISLGRAAGQSLPASGRNMAIDCSRDWHLLDSKCPTREGLGMLEWGDATVYLGYYMANLALEYALLKEAGQDTEASLGELALAIEAFARLDEAAEASLGLAPERNGFFLRDDVPSDFYLLPSGAPRFFGKEQAYNCIRSDAACGGNTEGKLQRGTFVSQDQIIALFLGFAFVEKFVGEEAFPFSNTSFAGEVALHSHRIMSYLQKWNWWIHTPDGQKLPERWGANVRAFNYPLALAAKRITDGHSSKKSYQQGGSKSIGRMAYNAAQGWAFGLQAQRNKAMIYTLALLCRSWSPERMARRSLGSDQALYALLQAVLNEEELAEPLSRRYFYAFLCSAPPDGPCFNSPDCQAPPGWRSFDRFWHARHKDGNPYGRAFEFCGLDYMLCYNLYHYYYRGLLPKYKIWGLH